MNGFEYLDKVNKMINLEPQARKEKMKITPGEWHRSDSCFEQFSTYRNTRTGGRAFITAGESGLDLIANVQGATQEEAEANARLIAAAPKMLDLLKELRKFTFEAETPNICRQIDAILAKVEVK